MSIDRCINAKVKLGRLTKDQAQEAMSFIDDFSRDYSGKMGPDAARAQAGVDAAKALDRKARKAKEQAALQILATDRVVRQALAHDKGVAAGVAAVFARDLYSRAGNISMEARQKTVKSDLTRRFGAGIDAYRSKAAGLKQDKMGVQNFVRALYDEPVDDDIAKAAKKAWEDATDYGRNRFNAAGGDLPRRENWRLPQHWDRRKVAVSRETFMEYMRNARANGQLRVVDFDTGLSADDLKFEVLLGEAYENITQNGLNKLVPGQKGGAKLANRRADPRIFEWTTADAWLDFNRNYGTGDDGIYGVLTGHLDGLARDIAQLEALGPNPDLTARLLIDHARKAGSSDWKISQLEAIYAHASGKASSPVGGMLANLGSGLRNWLSSAQLGSAVLSSATDFATLRATAKFNGLDDVRVMGTYFKLLNPADDTHRRIAAKVGLIAETALTTMHAGLRHNVDETVSGLAGKFNDTVLRASGLSAHTDAARVAYGLDAYSTYAEAAATAFGDLPKEIKRTFQAYGITAKDWDIIRTAGVRDVDGIKLIDPDLLFNAGKAEQEAGTKLIGAVLTETDYAVFAPGARERAFLTGGHRRGTVAGELFRSFAQYKSFPVGLWMTHGMRGVSNFKDGGAQYLAALTIQTTLLAALVVQAKAIASGKDPRDMTKLDFWGAAFMQGGGAGILGDFINSGTARNDLDFWSTLAGPGFGFANDTVNLTLGNIGEGYRGDNTNFGRELARYVQRYTPGSSLWYSRLAMDRLLWNRLQELLDPKAREAFGRMEQRARKEYDQTYWWRPGQATPSRAPDLRATTGN